MTINYDEKTSTLEQKEPSLNAIILNRYSMLEEEDRDAFIHKLERTCRALRKIDSERTIDE